MEDGSKDLFTLCMSYATSAMLEITGVCVREGKQRQTERAVIYKIKPYKLQLSTLPKAIFTGIAAFDSHKIPGRYEMSGSGFSLLVIEIQS